ncbi:partial Beta-lactamase, partial [Anaerolineae bacterium]
DEIGAAVCAYWRGRKVVDLWGGRRLPDADAPWLEDTMVLVHSTTKGVAALTLALAHSRALLDYDSPVARYWPEFAQNGKEAITVRQLLAHEAGLAVSDVVLTVADLRDLDAFARVLARQKPAWEPGKKHGYHAMSIGLYAQEIIRRVDPAHRTLGRFFHDEIAAPLGLDFYIGLPPAIPEARLAKMLMFSNTRALKALFAAPFGLIARIIWPWSLLRKTFRVLADLNGNERRSLEVDVPSGNGVGTARALARLYSVFVEGGQELGLRKETLDALSAKPTLDGAKDVVMGTPASFALGLLRPGPSRAFGSSERAFGMPGAGGSFAFGDPDAHLGYAYVMNKMDFHIFDDPREKPLRDAIHRSIEAQT